MPNRSSGPKSRTLHLINTAPIVLIVYLIPMALFVWDVMAAECPRSLDVLIVSAVITIKVIIITLIVSTALMIQESHLNK